MKSMSFRNLLVGALLGVLSLSSGYAQQSQSVDGLYANIDYEKLFNQARVLDRPEYACALIQEGLLWPDKAECKGSHLTSADLDAALSEDFSSTKDWLVTYELVEPVFSFGTNVVFFGLIPRLVGMSETGGGFSHFVLSSIVSEKVLYFTKLLCRMYINPESDPLNTLEHRYAVKKRHLPVSLQKTIEGKFAAARKSPMELDQLLGFLRTALNVPTQSATLELNATDLAKLQQKLEGYEPDVYTQIRSALIDHIARFSTKSAPNPSPKTVLYFEGKPGLGKTYTARMVAEALGVPLLEINVASDGMDAVIGSPQNPGRILEAFTQQGSVRNGVLFLDEVSDEVNKQHSPMLSHLKAFIEPSSTHFYSPYLGAKVDISHVLIILAGNAALENEALRTRTQTVLFNSLKPEFKERVVLREILPKVARSEAIAMTIDPEDPKIIEAAKALILSDEDPGFRNIEYALKDIVNRMRLERLMQKSCRTEELEANNNAAVCVYAD